MTDWEFEPVENYEITFEWPNGDWTWLYESAPSFHDALVVALDKCPDTARVHNVRHMTVAQVAANMEHERKRRVA